MLKWIYYQTKDEQMNEYDKKAQNDRQAYRRRHRQMVLRRQRIKNALFVGAIAVVAIMIAVIAVNKSRKLRQEEIKADAVSDITGAMYNPVRPELDVELLTPNSYSRPQLKLEKVNGVVVHYTANPGTTAMQNRDYFEGLAESKETKASSHFIIGLDGEIVQCIPCSEISYASNDRNSDTISIECCIEDDTGKFNDSTYQSLVELTTWLMGRYELDTEDIIRHYDVTGKICPKYYVENESAWEQFHKDLELYIKENGVTREE